MERVNSMGLSLLAPVPARHIKSALDTFKIEGMVAFGSNAFSVFQTPEGLAGQKWKGATVLIYVSHPEPDYPGFGPNILYAGKFVRWRPADRRGKHPEPEYRPASTVTDTQWAGFWEIENLEKLPEKIALADLRSSVTKKPFKRGFTPEGPVPVEAVDLP